MNQTLPPIVSLSPLRAAVFGWRAAQARMLTVVCKATYTLRPVESPLAEQQEDPNEGDDHWDDDAEKSLRAPSDLVPSKPRAELMVVGSAFAPDGAARSRLPVRVIVGDVDKALAIIGDRAVLSDGSVAEPTPFAKMALRWERAAGGPGTSNPVGVRAEIDAYGKRTLPNVVPLDTSSASAIDLDPVGLGPMAPRWPLRAARLRGGAVAWAARGDFETPWPDDFDANYFLSAPWDQQLDALRSNERIVLENLHPAHARLVTSLPGVEPRVFIDVEHGTPHELSMRCDTLWIDTDRAICTLTWRGQLSAERPQPARIIVASSSGGRRLAWSDVAPLVRTTHSAPASRPSSKPPREPRTAPIEETASDLEIVELVDATAPLRDGLPAPALPFVGASIGATPARPRSASIAPVSSGLPFVSPSVAAGPASRPPPAPAPAHSEPPRPLLIAEAPAAPAASAASAASAAPAAPAVETPGRWDPTKGAGSFGRAYKPAAMVKTALAAPDFGVGSAVAAASNAAAQSAPPPAAAAPKIEAPAESSPPPPALAPASVRGGAERTFVDLLWFDPAVAPRLRTVAAFKPLFAAEPIRAPRDANDDKDADLHERRDVLRALTGVAPLDGEPLRRTIDEQFADPATYSHPLVLVTGDLAPSFDELATLKVAVQIGGALGGGDKRIRDATAVAGEALRGDPPSRESAVSLTRSIIDAAAKSGGPPIQPVITRLLLDQRAFRKRHLFGAPRLRMELSLAKAGSSIPVYLPADAEATLPCLAKFRARVLAEVRPQEDYAETAADSFLGFAVARVLRGV